MSFGQIFSRSFDVIRRNPRPLLIWASLIPFAINLVAMTATAFPQALSDAAVTQNNPAAALPFLFLAFVASILQSLVSLVVSVLAQGYVLSNLREFVSGNRASNRAILRTLRPAWGRLIGYGGILLGFGFGFAILIFIVVFLVSIVATISGLTPNDPTAVLLVLPIVFILSLAVSAPLIWVTTKLCFTPALLVFERTTVGNAMRWSWRLTRGRFWRVLGTQLLLGLMIGAVILVVSLMIFIPFMASSGGAPGLLMDPWASSFAAIAAMAPLLLIAMFGGVVISNAVGLLMLDARAREYRRPSTRRASSRAL